MAALAIQAEAHLETNRANAKVGDKMVFRNGNVYYITTEGNSSDGGGDGGGSGSGGNGNGGPPVDPGGSNGGGWNPGGGEQTHCKQWHYVNGQRMYYEWVPC